MSAVGVPTNLNNVLLRLGNNPSFVRDFNGTIDEVMILNITLNSSQILQLYNNQSSRFFPRGEQIFKSLNVSGDGTENRVNITINSTTYFSSMINVSIGNSSGSDYVYYPEVNFSNNFVSNVSIGNPNNMSLKFIFYAGNISTNSFITPTLENNINVTSYTFSSDTTPPNINLTYPLNITYNTDVVQLNYTVGADATFCMYYNGTSNATIASCGNNLTMVSSEGNNRWIVYANDSSNNLNSSSVTFFKDTIAPSVNVSSPLNNTNYSYARIDLNVSSTGTDISRWWYSNASGLNSSYYAIGTNLSGASAVLWENGSNIIRVYINDTANNVNSTFVNFTVDTGVPLIYDIVETVTETNATINWTTNEQANSSVNYGLTQNLGTGINNNSLVISRAIQLTSLSAKTLYYYNVTSCDSVNNCRTNGTFDFTTAGGDSSSAGESSARVRGIGAPPAITEAGETFAIHEGLSIDFVVRDKKHSLKVLSVGLNSAHISVASHLIAFKLVKEETIDLDLDHDGKKDISITLVEIDANKNIKLLIKEFKKKAVDFAENRSGETEEPEILPGAETNEAVAEAEISRDYKEVIYSAMAIILILAVIYFYLEKGVKKKLLR